MTQYCRRMYYGRHMAHKSESQLCHVASTSAGLSPQLRYHHTGKIPTTNIQTKARVKVKTQTMPKTTTHFETTKVCHCLLASNFKPFTVVSSNVVVCVYFVVLVVCLLSTLQPTQASEAHETFSEDGSRPHIQSRQLHLGRIKRVPLLLLLPQTTNAQETSLRGSKSEPPSRPPVDRSRRRPYFGSDIARNISVELGQTAYLTCKVFELGDKTVSWLRPRESEILTSGRYTYINDPRFVSINDAGSSDWILEIKDTNVNDSTSYECQVSTDPKTSTIINLHVKAVKARIKQGEQYNAHIGADVEFTCDVGSSSSSHHYIDSSFLTASTIGATATTTTSFSSLATAPLVPQQTYWYFNGDLTNYIRSSESKNFSIVWDQVARVSRYKLFNAQLSDSGNYTCKPTGAEPATIRLHVKKSKAQTNGSKQNGGQFHYANSKVQAQRHRTSYLPDSSDLSSSSSSSAPAASSSFGCGSTKVPQLIHRLFHLLLSCLSLFLCLLVTYETRVG